MNAMKVLALLLILAGSFGLAYGHFSFTKETHEAKIGPIGNRSSQSSETVGRI